MWKQTFATGIKTFATGIKMYIQFATTKLVLLPGLELGSKSLLPSNKMNF